MPSELTCFVVCVSLDVEKIVLKNDGRVCVHYLRNIRSIDREPFRR